MKISRIDLNQIIFYLSASLTIIFWSSAYVGIRLAVTEYTPESLAVLRFLTASLFLSIYALIKKVSIPKINDLFLIGLAGFLGFFLYNITLNRGEMAVTAGTASFLISTAPIFTCLLSIFLLGEKSNVWGWVGIFISFLGISIISLSEGEAEKINIGVFLIIIASILISLYNVLQRFLLTKYKPLEVTCYAIWSGTLFMLIFLPNLIKEIQIARLYITLTVVYLGVFPAALGYLLWSYALSKTTSTINVVSFMYITPILTMSIGWFWISEVPPLLSIIGGMLALCGVVITNSKGK